MGSEELILRLETIFPAYNINSVMIREVPAVEPSIAHQIRYESNEAENSCCVFIYSSFYSSLSTNLLISCFSTEDSAWSGMDC